MLTQQGFWERQTTATYQQKITFPDGDKINVSVSNHASRRFNQRFFSNCSSILVDWLKEDLRKVLDYTYDAADLQKICVYNEARGSVIWYCTLWNEKENCLDALILSVFNPNWNSHDQISAEKNQFSIKIGKDNLITLGTENIKEFREKEED